METTIFKCTLCNYQSTVKCNYNKHLKTKMHMEKSQIQAQAQSAANNEIDLLKSQVEVLQNKVNILEEQNKNIINMLNNYFTKNEVNNNINDNNDFNKNEVNNNIDEIIIYEAEKVSIDDIITNSEIEEKKIDEIINERTDEIIDEVTDETYTDTDIKENKIQFGENKSSDEVEEELYKLWLIRGDTKFNNIDNETKTKYLNANFKQIQT